MFQADAGHFHPADLLRRDVKSAADATAIEPPVDVVLFEGWCVGAVPQPAAALREPLNALESNEDADGVWRGEVNRRLATDYARLFERLDMLLMLRIADFGFKRSVSSKSRTASGNCFRSACAIPRL